MNQPEPYLKKAHTSPRFQRWLTGSLLILLAAWFFDLGLLAYAMIVLLSVLIGSRILTRQWSEGLAAWRSCSELVADVGDRVAVNITIENRGSLPVAWFLLEDLLPVSAMMHEPPNLGVLGRRIDVQGLRRGARKTLIYQLQCNRRGYYQIGPLVLETGDLFGLHRRYKVMSQPNYLLVYPRVIPLEGFDIASRRPIGEVRMTYRLYEDPTRIAGVRHYLAGDPLNRVHWRATASTGKLHSKVYEPSTVIGATILMDFHHESYEAKHEPVRSELAITAAASLANCVYETGQQVGLISNGRDAADRVREEGWVGDARTRQAAQQSAAMQNKSDRLQPVLVPTRRGAEQFIRILTTLARLELTDGLSFPHLLLEVAGRMPRDATVMVILPKVTTQHAIALSNLARQGFAVTAILNLYEPWDFAQASGPLLAAGIETIHLQEEDSVTSLCRHYAVR